MLQKEVLGTTGYLHMRVKGRPRYIKLSFPSLLCHLYSKRAAILTSFSGWRSNFGTRTINFIFDKLYNLREAILFIWASIHPTIKGGK